MAGRWKAIYLEQSENLLQTLCMPLDYLDLSHTDGQMALLKQISWAHILMTYTDPNPSQQTSNIP